MKVFRDPVHDIISFDKVQEKYILDLLDSRDALVKAKELKPHLYEPLDEARILYEDIGRNISN